MAIRALPRMEAYIAALPAGLDSYPTCKQKGSLTRLWVAEMPLAAHLQLLPPDLRTLVEQPPLASAWVPEVHANALYLAASDLLFPREDDFVECIYRLDVKLFQSPLYRAITLIASPASFLRGLELGWKLFRRGQHIAITTTSPTSLRIRVTWPPLVTPMLIARCVGTGFRAAAEATGTVTGLKADLTEFDRTTAVYDISWR